MAFCPRTLRLIIVAVFFSLLTLLPSSVSSGLLACISFLCGNSRVFRVKSCVTSFYYNTRCKVDKPVIEILRNWTSSPLSCSSVKWSQHHLGVVIINENDAPLSSTQVE